VDDETAVASHSNLVLVLVAFVSADPSPDVGTTVLDDPRTAHRTQGNLYDRARNVALQRLLPRPHPKRRDTPLTSGRCARKSMGGVL
jgi:hypothetical protein